MLKTAYNLIEVFSMLILVSIGLFILGVYAWISNKDIEMDRNYDD